MKKVVLYSSNSKDRGKSHFLEAFPKWNRLWEAAAERYKDLEITVVLQLNNRYYLDFKDEEPAGFPKGVRMVVLPNDAAIPDFLRAIEAEKPDVAVAMTHPISGYDWNGIRDAVIAESLRDDGIETICGDYPASLVCFDKAKTFQVLRDNGFRVSEAVTVEHELFTLEGAETGSTLNAYRESILWKIRKLAPVIIKAATGSGSVGIRVCRTYEEAEAFLLSGAFDKNAIVERLLEGEEYGVEIHGCGGKHTVSPPYRKLSYEEDVVNDPLGATTLKYGPVLSESIRPEALRAEMLRLANLLGFTGIVNLDLFFVNGDWYILDINGRWSGITSLVSASQGRSAYEVFLDQVTGDDRGLNDWTRWKYCCQFKMPQTETADFGRMVEDGDLTSVSNEQIRIGGETRWYNDAVTAGYDSPEALAEGFRKFREKYPEMLCEKSVRALEKDIASH